MFADKTATKNRDTIGSPGPNYWPYHDCQRERGKKKRTGGQNNCESRQKRKTKGPVCQSGGASNNSTGCRDSVNCGYLERSWAEGP